MLTNTDDIGLTPFTAGAPEISSTPNHYTITWPIYQMEPNGATNSLGQLSTHGFDIDVDKQYGHSPDNSITQYHHRLEFTRRTWCSGTIWIHNYQRPLPNIYRNMIRHRGSRIIRRMYNWTWRRTSQPNMYFQTIDWMPPYHELDAVAIMLMADHTNT